ncbi:hypothetical protein BU17DRAFT_77267 [Hysterangium stoloniferum]|nr:hypothetical protein BU17DRAFT_77267 [Hysterangium stoloniferum]
MGPYSEHNPVPTTQRFESQHSAQTLDEQIDLGIKPKTQGDNSGKYEKEQMMDKMAGAKQKPTEKVKQRMGERVVKDPVTGREVTIKDADFKGRPVDAIPPGNISFQPFLPARPLSLEPFMRLFDLLQLGLATAFILLWFWFSFPSGCWWIPFTWPWLTWMTRSTFILGLGFGAVSGASIIQRKLEKETERFRAEMHQARGERFSPPNPESVEWLNAFTRTIWGLLNPEIFVSVADMIEGNYLDSSQSLSSFVDAVRISDIGQGINPVRIIAMRALPDQPGDKEYPREEWIDQGTNLLLEQAEKARVEGRDNEQSGDYVNFEVAFSYQALPGQGNDLRSKNIHLLMEFFLGLYDWLHIPIPIWIQIEGFVGTVRMRIQFIPEFPFVGNVSFTLMGVPAVEVSAVPMAKVLPNVLDLPLVSRFVKLAIAAGTAEFVAPKSMTLNIQEMMSGAAIGDTRVTGVFIITIHYAKGLSAQDSNGRSDPYIVLAYAKFGKPLYSTRIIIGDLNPCFEEMAALLVTEDEIKSDEELSVMLWDSDQRSPDDLIGRVQIPVKKLMENPNKTIQRTDNLTGFEDADVMSGTLCWSVGYFNKVPLNKELERAPEAAPPMPRRTAPAARDLPPPQPDIQRTLPEAEYPSGILSVVIHRINNLERQNLKGTTSKDREGQAGQDTDEPSEQSSNLPSAYCEIIINDDLIYKTRVKQYTTMPFFEAGTDRFIRDWQSTVVRLVVRDSRLREKDPILGIVNLNLKDLFRSGSEVSRLFAITEGIGFGRMNVSVLFRSVNVKLPRSLLGWDTCTVEILGPIMLTMNSDASALRPETKYLTVFTTDSKRHVPASAAENKDGVVTWKIDRLRLPVYNRYSSSLNFEIGKHSVLPGQGGTDALAVVWLKDLVDDEETDVDIPLVITKDLKQLRQNVLNDFTASTHDYEVVGHIRTRIKLDSGLDQDHEFHATTQSRRHAFETYDHIEGEAIIAEKNSHANDDGVIDKEEKKAIARAHKRQLANRQRGIHSFRPYRTAVWMKQGLKKRIMPTKASTREPTVQSEV